MYAACHIDRCHNSGALLNNLFFFWGKFEKMGFTMRIMRILRSGDLEIYFFCFSSFPAFMSGVPPGSFSLPSKGSSLHGDGRCSPCAWCTGTNAHVLVDIQQVTGTCTENMRRYVDLHGISWNHFPINWSKLEVRYML